MIMESPEPLPRGTNYQLAWLNNPPSGWSGSVTLTVTGDHWSLDSGATLHDVTHLPCRSAKYTPQDRGSSVECLPENLVQEEFPVTPGASMPHVPGCRTSDYAVLFVHV